MRVFTGGGKTTETLRTIDKYYSWIYITPRHQIIRESLKDSLFRMYDFLHMEGRERTCLFSTTYEPLIKKGYDIRSICKKCTLRKSCPYERNVKKAFTENPNLAITHAHMQNWLPKFLNTKSDDELIKNKYDVLIIDENPIKSFMQTIKLTYQEAALIKQLFIQSDCDKLLVDFMTCILSKEINYKRIEELNIKEINLIENINKFTEHVFELFKHGAISIIPKNIIHFIYNMYDYVGLRDITKMIQRAKGIFIFNYFNPNTITNLDFKKIICLDGTATKEVWENALGGEPYMIKHYITYKNCFQFKNNRYPISSWVSYDEGSVENNTPERLVGYIDKIAKRKKRKVLVVCTKAIQKMIEELTSVRNLIYANYYALRGTNDFWLKVDTVILAVEPNPPEFQIEIYSELSGWTKDIWRIVFRKEEMLQAIGRIREHKDVCPDGTIRETREVYIFPNTGVKDGLKSFESDLVPEAEVIYESEFKAMIEDWPLAKRLRTTKYLIMQSLPCGKKRIRDICGGSRRRELKYTNYLIMKGYIKDTGRGDKRYQITDKGRKSIGRTTFRIEA